MRGERVLLVYSRSGMAGSSPHARGTQLRVELPEHICRFIPACAGNARGGSWRTTPATVHPRMRGERRKGQRPEPRSFGSSPHARGTRRAAMVLRRGGRFIPACAGNAPTPPVALSPSAVHPRMRGERQTQGQPIPYIHGSSPHARGTPTAYDPRNRAWRFIPACAGNASLQKCLICSNAVHPRMRGERVTATFLASSTVGSSPHARGTHFQ